MAEFPNDLFENGRRILGRYGYRPGGGEIDRAAEWTRVKADFPFAAPDWADLGEPQQRAAALAYLDLRRTADRRLEECEALHAELLSAGVGGDLVERYAAARETYEDTVEAFGAARQRLQGALAP